MEKVIIFVDSDDGTPWYLVRVENYDERFDDAVRSIRQEWYKSTDELYEFLFRKLKELGYRVSQMDYNILAT